jgi:hypothetical protein
VESVACAFVEELMCMHGVPESVLSDQGHEFLNDVLQQDNANLQIHKLTVLPGLWSRSVLANQYHDGIALSG